MKNVKIAVIGLGYVGLPLAVEFAKKREVIGFDINHARIAELKSGNDNTLETTPQELKDAMYLSYSTRLDDIKDCGIYIVTVPTPIDKHNNPDLTPLRKASEAVGSVLNKGDIVIYESTVYPGATEEVCVPLLEQCSGLKFNQDFYCGYSPERINPGDKAHRITTIKKVTAGSTREIATQVDELYQEIITAGTHKAIEVGYHPEMILAGRRLNGSMGVYIAEQVAKVMTKKRIHVVDAHILVMGLTFKENCPDLRNTGVINLIHAFADFNCHVDVYDPWVDKAAANNEYGITPIDCPINGKYDAILLAVAHDEFKRLSAQQIRAFGKQNHVLYDIKYLLQANEVDGRL